MSVEGVGGKGNGIWMGGIEEIYSIARYCSVVVLFFISS